jgi:hypothetical protein
MTTYNTSEKHLTIYLNNTALDLPKIEFAIIKSRYFIS